MISESTLPFTPATISCDKEIILKKIFAKPTWLETLANEGLMPFLIGCDMERFDQDGVVDLSQEESSNQTQVPPYLAMVIAAKGYPDARKKYDAGLVSHRELTEGFRASILDLITY